MYSSILEPACLWESVKHIYSRYIQVSVTMHQQRFIRGTQVKCFTGSACVAMGICDTYKKQYLSVAVRRQTHIGGKYLQIHVHESSTVSVSATMGDCKIYIYIHIKVWHELSVGGNVSSEEIRYVHIDVHVPLHVSVSVATGICQIYTCIYR